VVQVVGGRIVSCTCLGCADFRKREFELDGEPIRDLVEFIQQLDAIDRGDMLALEVGSGMHLGGGAAPQFTLRRVS
jgi:hypothetical protein